MVGLFVTSIVIVELYDVFDDKLAFYYGVLRTNQVCFRLILLRKPQFLKVADLPNRCEPHGRAGL